MNASPDPPRDGLGLALAVLAVVIWAAWLPATRLAIADGLGPLDIALLRYAVPAIVLAPVWWRAGLLPRGVPLPLLLAMLGWGAPFVMLVSAGMARASVAHTAALVPCTMPVIAAVAARVCYGERIPARRRAGIGLIAVAALCVLASVFAGGGATDLPTVGLLLLASGGWAAYTVAYRRSGLTAMQGAGIVFAWSTLLMLPVAAIGGTGMGAVPLSSLAFHFLVQGVLTGLVATVAYGLAIDRLGTARASSFSVLVPVLATVLAFFWLGEAPSVLDGLALAIGTLGVAAVNGVLPRRRSPIAGKPPIS